MDITQALRSAGIERLDAELLLAHHLHCDRAWIIAHPERRLSDDEYRRWEESLARRRAGEPIAYILGERAFYGRRFFVDASVHIPRPSTENLVTMVLEHLDRPHAESRSLEPGIIGVSRVFRTLPVKTIVDIGTGSGCIAVTLALELPDYSIIATDASAAALAVARKNAEQLGAAVVTFLLGDLLKPLSVLREPFLLVSNPPYLPSATVDGSPALSTEPRSALDGGNDGNAVLRTLIRQARAHDACAGLIVECSVEQEHLFA